LQEIYGADIPQTLISKITDKILPEVNEWQNRPLESIYPIICFDGIVFKSRKDSQIINKCIYSVLGIDGIDMEGRKKILGCWISENEGASFWVSICSDLRKRGVSDIFIACHDKPERYWGSHKRSISKDKAAALYRPSDSQLYKICAV